MTVPAVQFAGFGAIDTKAGANSGSPMVFRDLNGDELKNALDEPMGVNLLGADSDDHERIMRGITKGRMARAQAKKLSRDQQLDAAKSDDLDLLAGLTTGWFGILDNDKKPVAFTFDGVRQLYDQYPPARDQADTFIANRANFTKPSSAK